MISHQGISARTSHKGVMENEGAWAWGPQEDSGSSFTPFGMYFPAAFRVFCFEPGSEGPKCSGGDRQG